MNRTGDNRMPSRFAELVGHEAAVKRFLQAAAGDTLPPATLLTGIEGIGKRAFALLGAQYLNCHSQRPDDACGVCSSCFRVQQNQHPDVQQILPDGSQIKIEQIRALASDIQFRPFEGRRKAYILDPADAMNEHAANGLLKTLEEVPSYAWIVLVTAHPRSLPATSRSRCPVLPLLPVPAERIVPLLVSRGLEREAAATLARVSGGSIGRALSLDWKQLSQEREKGLDLLQSLARPAAFHEVRRFWTSLSAEEKKRERVEGFLRTLLVLLEDLLLIREGLESRITHVDLGPQLRKGAALYSFGTIAALEACIRSALQEADRNVNAQILLESLYFKR